MSECLACKPGLGGIHMNLVPHTCGKDKSAPVSTKEHFARIAEGIDAIYGNDTPAPTEPRSESMSVEDATNALCKCCPCHGYEAEAVYCTKCLNAILEAVRRGGLHFASTIAMASGVPICTCKLIDPQSAPVGGSHYRACALAVSNHIREEIERFMMRP